MTSDRRSLLLTSCFLLIAGAMLALGTPTAQAQDQTAPRWTQHFEAQMTHVLTQSVQNAQEDGLATLLVVVREQPPNVKFDALVAPVTNIVLDEKAPEDLRIMALSVLNEMDTRSGYNALMKWAQSDEIDSERLRRHVFNVLRSYQSRHGIA